ncbi:MAG: hypothetical protein ACYC4U_32700 [Pirellulaceae bacterium]
MTSHPGRLASSHRPSLPFGWAQGDTDVPVRQNKTGDANSTTYSGQVLRPGVKNRVVVTVQPHSVTVEVNDQQIIRWAGDAKELSTDRRFWPDSRGRMFLGSWQTTFRVSKFSLLPETHGLEKDARKVVD